MHQILGTLVTKEEVAGIVAYCEEKKVSHKQRLDELGISTWTFYDSKRKFAPKQDRDNAGEYLQLLPGESFLANPIKPPCSRGGRQKSRRRETISIELRMPTGTMMRIIGNLTGRELREIIDNNLVENAIRPLTLGRKNFLFCGNHDAAVRAAIVYSLVDRCKALGVDPHQWMEDVLLRIPGREDNRTALRELLPDKWAKQAN